VFVDLTAGINGEDVDHFGIAVHGEQNAPAANAGLSDSGPVGDGSRQARIEGVNGKLYKASPDTLFRWPVKAIKDLLGFVSDDSKTHRPRSRWYSARGFTRPAARSARPRSSEASASGSSGGPSSSAASRRSWSHTCASVACSSGNSSTSWWSASRVVILIPFHDNFGASWADPATAGFCQLNRNRARPRRRLAAMPGRARLSRRRLHRDSAARHRSAGSVRRAR